MSKKKTFRIPLLMALPAALPALLSACSPADDLSNYKRTYYASYQDCMRANQQYVSRGMAYPCSRGSSSGGGGGGGSYGPYTKASGTQSRLVGYTGSGQVSGSGLSYNSKNGSYGSFSSPVSRGGFSTSARGGSGSS